MGDDVLLYKHLQAQPGKRTGDLEERALERGGLPHHHVDALLPIRAAHRCLERVFTRLVCRGEESTVSGQAQARLRAQGVSVGQACNAVAHVGFRRPVAMTSGYGRQPVPPAMPVTPHQTPTCCIAGQWLLKGGGGGLPQAWRVGKAEVAVHPLWPADHIQRFGGSSAASHCGRRCRSIRRDLRCERWRQRQRCRRCRQQQRGAQGRSPADAQRPGRRLRLLLGLRSRDRALQAGGVLEGPHCGVSAVGSVQVGAQTRDLIERAVMVGKGGGSGNAAAWGSGQPTQPGLQAIRTPIDLNSAQKRPALPADAPPSSSSRPLSLQSPAAAPCTRLGCSR